MSSLYCYYPTFTPSTPSNPKVYRGQTPVNKYEESRYYLILTQDLGYGKTEELMLLLEQVSRLLNAYARTILASGS